jgi:hypothetical protein
MGKAGVDERDMSMDDRQHGAVVRWDVRQERSRTRGRPQELSCGSASLSRIAIL